MSKSQFIYLLNAFEQASQSKEPAIFGYGAKRQALLDYVLKLETPPPEEAALETLKRIAHVLNTAQVRWEGDTVLAYISALVTSKAHVPSTMNNGEGKS